MASNALSKKTLSTKTPAICKPVPWPPAVIPPPLPQAKFWLFASINWRHWLWEPNYAAQCFCTYQAGPGYWTGYSSLDVTLPRISVILNVRDNPNEWDCQISYDWPGPGTWGWEFWNQPLEGRPFLSELAKESAWIPVYRETTCVMREIPS